MTNTPNSPLTPNKGTTHVQISAVFRDGKRCRLEIGNNSACTASGLRAAKILVAVLTGAACEAYAHELRYLSATLPNGSYLELGLDKRDVYLRLPDGTETEANRLHPVWYSWGADLVAFLHKFCDSTVVQLDDFIIDHNGYEIATNPSTVSRR